MKKGILLALVIFAIPALTFAQIGLHGVGGQIGFVMPEDPIENSIGFGLNADLGEVYEGFDLVGLVDYWGKTYEESSFEWGYSVLSIGAVAVKDFAEQSGFTPYAGAGLGLDIVTVKAEYKGEYAEWLGADSKSSESETDLAILLVGGAKKEINSDLTGFAEAKYVISDLSYLTISAGVTYALTK